MRFTFVSNYINHHQIPFAEAMLAEPDVDFCFIQTMPMEEERIRMGWAAETSALPYVLCLYEDEAAARTRIMESDMVLFGWTDRFDLAAERLAAGLPLLRVSERIYKEGQWKAASPRGLLAKYREHTKYRRSDCWMLCAGAYAASDFALIRSYPGKCFRWGYFPKLRHYAEGALEEYKKRDAEGTLRLLFAGRFVPGYKHPEFALHLAERLRERGVRFRLDMIGGGEMEEELREYAEQRRLCAPRGSAANVPAKRVLAEGAAARRRGGAQADPPDAEDFPVVFRGFLSPDEVRAFMERAQVFLFPSNHLEGWGAVLNEAMNSGCAVVAGAEAGASPYLIRHGENGLLFAGEDERDFIRKALWLTEDPERVRRLGRAAEETIRTLWNAETAARELLRFTRYILACRAEEKPVLPKGWDPPREGPMSPAPRLRPFVRPKEEW
ncbi:glycosyltransferase [Lachnoclostridium sp. Marseille-P6806]|uniref:glycosyltransferase n=1 Tax=Lachnoclostridium sp. Marseille-P6806 TaxID=2364793 RepID=UPI0010314A11|nr:glycosyltransferase [Lachnoclostridium sp. Marseille-P6806]